MPTPSRDSYDVIIIGAGIGGLVCGCYLARAGMKVLIIEQHDKPGGYFTSFKRKGFLFDSAAHSFGNYRQGGHVHKVFSEIGLDKRISIKRYDPSDIIVTPDQKLVFGNDKRDTIAGLSKYFPQEKDNIARFIDFLTLSDQFEFAKLKNKTFGSLLQSFFKDERLISSLATPAFGNGGLPPSLMHAFSGSKIFSEFVIDGGYYPEGGMQNLPNALDQIIHDNNGRIIYRRLVKKIICKNQSVIGVKLDTNEVFASKYVVSACDMVQTFKTLLGKDLSDEHRLAALGNMIPSVSTFILYIGIDKPFKGLPEPGVNTWYLPHYDLDDMYRQIQKCNLSASGMYMLRVSPDGRTILAFVGAPFRTKTFWRQNKRRFAEDFLGRVELLVPDIKNHIVYFDAATPATLYRYTLNYRGAAFGWAKMPSQTFDPVMSKTTSVKGLYLTGHWTSLAFGMPGTCYSGQDTARRILRKEGILANSLNIE